jgi:MFS family permease
VTSTAVAGEAKHAGVFETFRELPIGGRFVLLGVYINQFGAFLQLFLVLYLTHKGFSRGEAGIALGAYSVGAVVGNLGGGNLSDWLGPRRTVVLSMGTAAVFTLAVTFLHNFFAILPVVAVAGAMTQASRTAVSALLLRMVPESRQVMTIAMYRTALNAGTVSGPLAATWLSSISWNLVFWVDAATSLAYCLIAAFLLQAGRIAAYPDAVAAQTEAADRATAPGEPAPAAETASQGATAAAPRSAGYLTMLQDRRYVAYLAIMLANGLVHIQFFVVLPLMLVAEGYHTWGYGVAVAISAAIVVGAGLPMTKITQNFPTWKPVMGGWSLMLIGCGIFAIRGSYIIIIIATVLAATAQTIGGPGAFAYPAEVAPEGAVGRYLGTAYGMFGLGYTVGPIVGITLYDLLGHGFWLVVLLFGAAMIPAGIWGMRPAGQARTRGSDPAPQDAAGQFRTDERGADAPTAAELSS